MRNYQIFLCFLFATVFQSCIQDDFVDDQVDPLLTITSSVDTIEEGTEFQFESRYLNNIGNEVEVVTTWSSSDPSIISILDSGLATANSAGSAMITVSHDDGTTVVEDTQLINVGASTVVVVNQMTEGSIVTTSTYVLEGDFVFEETDTGVRISFADNYKASTALPGLFVYLSNNANSVANALEIGGVETFNGAHTYDVDNVGFSDYQFLVYFCKPFNIKVGDGDL